MPKAGFKVITIPEKYHSLLMKLKKRYNEPMWKITARAIAFYLRNEKELDRYFYYATKLMNSWAMVKCSLYYYDRGFIPLNIVKEEVGKFIKTVRQIEYRTHVKVTQLNTMVKELVKAFDDTSLWNCRGKIIAKINDEVRNVVRALLLFEVEK